MKRLLLALVALACAYTGFITHGIAQDQSEQVNVQKIGNCGYFQADPPGMEYQCQGGDKLSIATIERGSSATGVTCSYSSAALGCLGTYQGNDKYNLQFICSSGNGWSGEKNGPWTCANQ